MDPTDTGGDAAHQQAEDRRRDRLNRRAADFRQLEAAAQQAATRHATAVAGLKKPKRARRAPRRAARPPLSMAPTAMAVLVLVMAAVGGSNSALLGSMAALGQLGLAAMIFARGAIPASTLRAGLPVLLPLAVLVLWAMLPLASLGEVGRWVAPDLVPQALAKLAGMLAMLAAAALIGLRAGRLRNFAESLTRGTALLIMVTVVLRSVDLPADWQIAMEDTHLHRFSATIGNPNAAGVLFAMLGLVASGLTIERFLVWYDLPGEKRLYAMMSTGLVSLGCLAVVGITQSRSALLLWLAAHLALVAVSGWPRLRRMANRVQSGRWIALGTAVTVALVALLASATLDRLEVLTDDGAGRQLAWETYGAAALRAPLTGYGLGSFPAWNQSTLTAATAHDLWDFGAAHAAPLQVVLETGWIGLALALAAGAALAWSAGRTLQHEPVAVAMALAVVVALVASLVDIALNVPAIACLAACLAGLLWGRSLRI